MKFNWLSNDVLCPNQRNILIDRICFIWLVFFFFKKKMETENWGVKPKIS